DLPVPATCSASILPSRPWPALSPARPQRLGPVQRSLGSRVAAWERAGFPTPALLFDGTGGLGTGKGALERHRGAPGEPGHNWFRRSEWLSRAPSKAKGSLLAGC